jgi:hypothetical protein
MNDGVENIWVEAVMALFKVLSRHLPGRTGENYEHVKQDIRSPGRDLNPGLSEYEAGMLTTGPQCSVDICYI